MNSIIRLRLDDFDVQKGTKGNILCVGIKDLSLVMFYSPLCKICESLIQKFRQLPQIINNVKFCVLNINENVGVINMSEQTIAPIKFVPFIVLYVNGRPFLQYDDAPDLNRLVEFVKYSVNLVNSKKSFIDKGAKVEQQEIPKFTIAKPYHEFKCEGDFCYLTTDSAYAKK